MRVVFTLEYPFSQRDYDRWGIEFLQREGFGVAVWDFTPFIYPHAHTEIIVPDPIQFNGLRVFATQAEAFGALAQLPRETFVMCLIGYRPDTYVLYRTFSKLHLRYGVSKTEVMPNVGSREAPSRQVTGKVRRFKLAWAKRYALRYLPPQLVGVQPATAVLAGGAHSLQGDYPIGRQTRVLWAHTMDYDTYLRSLAKPVLVDQTQGVFIDQYGPFHPESRLSGFAVLHTPEEYYAKLCRFFSFLEKNYGVRIVIAAHPRSRYEDHPDYFQGRLILRDKTLDLIRSSRFVISHGSAATCFAIMLNTPILFLIDDKMQRMPELGPGIIELSAWLNQVPINLDRPLQLDWQRAMMVDTAAFEKYRNAFLKKTGSPEKLVPQIFADYLKTLVA